MLWVFRADKIEFLQVNETANALPLHYLYSASTLPLVYKSDYFINAILVKKVCLMVYLR
jgi:hypothetical protein